MTPDIVSRTTAALRCGIDQAVAQRPGSRRDIFRAALGLEHVILSGLLGPDEEREALVGLESGRITACQDLFCRLETVIENSFAALVLSGGEATILRNDSVSEGYLSRYEELARREIALAGITSRDRVLFVGSGPFPITAIEYCRQTGCTVDCVDLLAEAIETSREVLERLGLSGSISCRRIRGEEMPASEYSVVLVGVLAQPKQEIFRNLDSTCPAGCRVIARTTFGLRELIYQPAVIDASGLKRLGRTGKSEATGDQVISSFLYVKAR